MRSRHTPIGLLIVFLGCAKQGSLPADSTTSVSGSSDDADPASTTYSKDNASSVSSSSSVSSGATGGSGSSSGLDLCSPLEGSEYEVTFEAPDAGEPGLGGTLDASCAVLASTAPGSARLDCGQGNGLARVDTDLPGVDLSQLPADVHAVGSLPGFESGSSGVVILTGLQPSHLLFFSLEWPSGWDTPDAWAELLAPLRFDYEPSDCAPYVPDGDPNATCVAGTMRISSADAEVELGTTPLSTLGSYTIFVGSIAECQLDSAPPPNGTRLVAVHESLVE